ncbi:MAG: response regulator transcription factor, partial [Clostridia bacterium]|nr:response regulator transcription factor [Clostridia bacterium]
RYKILLIDNGSDVIDDINASGYMHSFEIVHIADPFAVYDYLKENIVDLIITELLFSEQIDGIEMLRCIKKEHPHIPVIVLSQITDPVDVVLSLEIGADDYIRKPFNLRELVARVKNAISHTSNSYISNDVNESKMQNIIEYKGIVIDKNSFTVSVNGKEVHMPPKEIELLYCLASQPDTIFTRSDLLDRVWGYDYFGGTRTVDIHVKRIRDKIDGTSARWTIRTVWGKGYKFVAK